MLEGGNEDFGDISAGDSITGGKRKRVLRHFNRMLPTRSVQQHACSDDRVGQATSTNLALKFRQTVESDGVVRPPEVMYRKRPPNPHRRAASRVLTTPWYSVALTSASRTG